MDAQYFKEANFVISNIKGDRNIQDSACVRSVVYDSVTPVDVAYQAPLSMGFCRQEYWNGLPFPTPGDLPDPGITPMSLASPALAGGFFITVPLGKPKLLYAIKGVISLGTSLVAQLLRICLLMQGTWVRSLVGELRSHMPWGTKPICHN